MTVVAEEPPEDDPSPFDLPADADEWTEEEWLAWLAALPADPDTGRAHPLSRMSRTSGGVVLGAAMFGLEAAIYGERHKVEIVAEASSDGLDLGDMDLDADDPAASHITIDPH